MGPVGTLCRLHLLIGVLFDCQNLWRNRQYTV